MTDVARLQQELATVKANNESLVERLRAKDMELVELNSPKPVEVNPMLKFYQEFVGNELADHVEDYRQQAWKERKVFLEDYPQAFHDGGWPEGLTAEVYVR